MAQNTYNDLDGGNATYGSSWEKPASRSKKQKMIVIGSIVGIVAIIAIAVGVGVSVSRNKGGGGNGEPVSTDPNGAVNQTDPNDPSTFIRDERLHRSFYGFAYTPEDSLYPECGNSLPEVIADIQLLSQLTSRIRLYGADCNQSALVLEAIKQTKVDMTVWLGNYVLPDDPEPYVRQRDAIIDALKTYGDEHVGGVTVGNEFMLNYLTGQGVGDSSLNTAIGNAGAELLIANITDTRNVLADEGFGHIPVGTSDAGSFFNNDVLGAVDYGLANVHPWFANVTVQVSADWTADFFQTQDVDLAATLPNNPEMYIAETGWPTKSSDLGNANNGASDASEENLQIFLDTFVCQANQNNTKYFFFEYADEIWKDEQFGGVEGWWGLFTSNRTLKNIVIPDCPSP